MEKRETITLDARAQQRLYVLNHVLAGGLTAEEAARVLHLSVRQVRRLLVRYRSAEGAAALVHGNHGRAPAHRLPDDLRGRLVELATTTYAGANRTHLAELLAEREGLVVAARTLHRILDEAGVSTVRTRRPARHRSRRERMPRAGLLVQTDGSRHDWLEGRGPMLTLVGGIDDATGIVTGAVFREQEDAAGYFTMLRQTVAGYGLPGGLYSDRHGIFWRDKRTAPTLVEQLAGRRRPTQVGRALEVAGIAWIAARSPQAKGRVERLWGTLQDRLVTELRLAGAATLDAANLVLADHLPRHNARFAVPAVDPVPAWRHWPDGPGPEAVFAFVYARRVARDATIVFGGSTFGLPARPDGRSWAGRAVELQERLDGSLWVAHDDLVVPLAAAPSEPVVLRARRTSQDSSGRADLAPLDRRATSPTDEPPAEPWRPARNHPWRGRFPDSPR